MFMMMQQFMAMLPSNPQLATALHVELQKILGGETPMPATAAQPSSSAAGDLQSLLQQFQQQQRSKLAGGSMSYPPAGFADHPSAAYGRPMHPPAVSRQQYNPAPPSFPPRPNNP